MNAPSPSEDDKTDGAPMAEDGTPVDPETLERLQEIVPGATGLSPLAMPPAAWWAILKRVYAMTGFHNLSLLAAGVAFFAFLAFVPLIGAVVLLYGLFGDPGTVADSLDVLRGIAPPDVLRIVHDQLLAIVTSSKTLQGVGLIIALLFSLYGAMRSATAMIAALNIIYEEYETRSIVRVTLLAARITLGMVLVVIVGLLAISLFTYATNWLASFAGYNAALAVQIATWVIAALVINITIAAIFRFAPDRRAAKWRWLSVGSILSTLLWLVITLGFGFYVANVTDYNATYGSLGAVVVFLMWLYLSAYAVLLGAEFNSEMERQTMVDSTVGPDRPIGLRGAFMADSVVVDQASRALLEKKRRRQASDHAKRKS